jgi:hypothetical protein
MPLRQEWAVRWGHEGKIGPLRYTTEEAAAEYMLPGDTTVCRWYSSWCDPADVDDTQIIGIVVDQDEGRTATARKAQ